MVYDTGQHFNFAPILFFKPEKFDHLFTINWVTSVLLKSKSDKSHSNVSPLMWALIMYYGEGYILWNALYFGGDNAVWLGSEMNMCELK